MSKIWTRRFILTHNTELYKLIISWYEKLSHIKLTVKHLETIVDFHPQSDASDRMEQPASLFLVLYSDRLPGSAFCKPRSATDNAAEATDDFVLHVFFLIYLNKNTV